MRSRISSLLRRAFAETCSEQVSAEAARSSPGTRALLETLRDPGTLFDQELQCEALLRRIEGGWTEGVAFHREIGQTLWHYILERRLETAKHLLSEYPELGVGEIAEAVGFSGRNPFYVAFKGRYGLSPTALRNGEALESEQSTTEELLAEITADFWEAFSSEIASEDQEGVLEAFEFESPVLVDFLGERYLEASRLESRQRGVDVAELAVLSVEASAGALGDSVQDLRALTQTRLANARRLACDLEGAEAAIREAEATWKVSRERIRPAVSAEMLGHKAQICFSRCRFKEAVKLLDEMISECRDKNLPVLLAQALILRAGIIDYSGLRGEDTVSDLEEALETLEGQPEQERMLLVTALVLAFCHIQGRQFDSAKKELERTERYKKGFDADPMLMPHRQWLQGLIAFGKMDLEAAEKDLAQAREEFLKLREADQSAVVSVDLARLRFHQGQTSEVLRLASEALPILESLKAKPEILVLDRLLREAIERRQFDDGLLRDVRDVLIRSRKEPGQ